MILWVRNLGKACLINLLFHEALMEVVQRYPTGSWAESFIWLIPCRDGSKLGSMETVSWSSSTWPFQCSGFKVVRCLTWQLRALWKSVSVSKVKATWPFMIQPQKSHLVSFTVCYWSSKHSQASPILSPDSRAGDMNPSFHRWSVKEFVGHISKLSHNVWL